jgi:hypothetical protein
MVTAARQFIAQIPVIHRVVAVYVATLAAVLGWASSTGARYRELPARQDQVERAVQRNTHRIDSLKATEGEVVRNVRFLACVARDSIGGPSAVARCNPHLTLP